MTDSDDPQAHVTIERTFRAPVDLVWQMWTNPLHFAAWYGPTGAAVTVLRMETEVGGARLVGMEMMTPNGLMRMWFTGEYREVVANKRLVYTESMSNEDGDIIAASDVGLPPGHSTPTEVHVELEDLGDRTRMVMTHVGIPAESAGAVGWTMAIDKLTAYLRAL